MKMVSPFVLRGFATASLGFLAACSGTPTEEPNPASPAGETTAPPAVLDDVTNARTPRPGQDPAAGQGGVGEQRRSFLIDKSLTEAQRALDLRLWSDSAKIASEVLEMDPSNADARRILVAAQGALGVGGVESEFVDKVRQGQVAQQKMLFDVRRELNMGNAEMDLGKFGDAVDHFERGLLLLRYSPMHLPGSDLQNTLEIKLDAAKQAKSEAQRAEDEARTAASRAELEEVERKAAIQRNTRVKRLLEQANFDFQIGRYAQSVALLDQALSIDPNNAGGLELRELAARALHDNRLDLLRQDWKAEWAKTFDQLNADDVPQTEVLKYDLDRWRVVNERKPMEFTPRGELESPEEKAIVAKLDSTKIEHRFTSATVQDWADYYAKVSEVTFVVTPPVREMDESTTTLTDFHLPPMSVARALDVIGNVTGVRWKVENGVVKLVSPENAGGRRYLVHYEVRDIVQGVKSQPGPELKLKAPGDEDLGLMDEGEEPMPAVVDAGKLVDLIRTNIAPESWDDEGGASITEQRGVLLVRNTRQVQERVAKLLADLRQAVGIEVDVETRFLRVEDSFLEDIGVDFRGLGDQSSEGIPGKGLAGTPNTGFDDYGERSAINPTTPGEIGTGTEPGIFYNDGGDGDMMARTENLFETTLGGENGPLTNAGGLSLQWTYLDDTQLEVVLRAVEKQERSEIVTAPRLLIYNNTRASMSVLRHTSYIRDFDVEIAQAAAVANPIVDVVRDGVVLDVRPVVSADRRFITMELRPTVMTLETPIPTFTTTLGVGQPVSIQLPSVNLQRVRTTVTMPDGGTLMLGGMKLTQKQYQVSGVPILQDIPVLSFLFSRKGTFYLNRKILILIRANIIIPNEHLPDMGPEPLSDTVITGTTGLSGR